jgi:hypothetical protein
MMFAMTRFAYERIARGEPMPGVIEVRARAQTRTRWPVRGRSGILPIMHARASDASPIPSAPFDDLDLDRHEDEEEWDRRVMALAAARIAAERIRLQQLGIVDANGDLVSRELPPDMLPESDMTLETG